MLGLEMGPNGCVVTNQGATGQVWIGHGSAPMDQSTVPDENVPTFGKKDTRLKLMLIDLAKKMFVIVIKIRV